jgi:P4 family phage/plasmid primase-like protien
VTAAVSGGDPRWEAVELYLSLGWKLFPVPIRDDGRKVPAGGCEDCNRAGPEHDEEACDCLLCHGFYAATSDPHRLAQMCKLVVGGGILAVRTGAASGITVIDAEAHSRRVGDPTGLDILDEWEVLGGGARGEDGREAWSLPRTAWARTQSGGIHVFVRTGSNAEITSRNAVLPSIDVKSNGGYVLLPPGLAGERSWVGRTPTSWDDFAEPGERLLEWLLSRNGTRTGGSGGGGSTGKSEGYDYDVFLRDGPPPGFQNEFLNDLLWKLRRGGEVDAERLLHRVWPHVSRWVPEAGKAPYTEEDVRGKIRSIMRTVEPEAPTPSWTPPPRPTSPSETSNVTTIGSEGGADGPPAGDSGGGEGGPEGPEGLGPGGPAPADPRRVEEATDTGNAHRLARLLGDRMRYVSDLGTWLVWDGVRWRRDRKNVALDLTLHVINDVHIHAAAQPEDDRPRWQRHGANSESARARKNMLDLAAVLPELAVVAEELDTDPWVLVVRNGVLDLRTGELVTPDQSKLCTLQADVTYDPAATCPRWEEHVAFVTQRDPVLTAYLRRIAGYTLTGSTEAHAFFSLEGTGANGKNVFIEPLMYMLGDYATTAQAKLIVAGADEHATIIADLVGRRMVFVDEVPQGKRVDVERIKTLTGSTRLKGRFMRQDYFEFPAHLKLWVAGNEQPRIKDDSDGIWRRMHRILFEATVPEDRKIADYGRILFEEEGSGILNWCLAGLEDWRLLGSLGKPEKVSNATSALQHDEDYVAVFLDEWCEITGSAAERVTNAALFAAFERWKAEAGVRDDRTTRVKFGQRITRVPGISRPAKSDGVVKIDGKSQRVVLGVRLLRMTDAEGIFGGPAGL